MLRDLGVERIRRERIAAAQQLESLGRHDQVQKPDFAANGTVAFGNIEMRRRHDFEADAAAVATAGVGEHGRSSVCALAQRDR